MMKKQEPEDMDIVNSEKYYGELLTDIIDMLTFTRAGGIEMSASLQANIADLLIPQKVGLESERPNLSDEKAGL